MTSTSRSARLAKWLSVPLGLVISALLIWQASYAAFSDNKTLTAQENRAELTDAAHDSLRVTLDELIDYRSQGADAMRVWQWVLFGSVVALTIGAIAAGILLWRNLHHWVTDPLEHLARSSRSVVPGGPAIVSGAVRLATSRPSSSRNGRPPKWSPCRWLMNIWLILLSFTLYRASCICVPSPQSIKWRWAPTRKSVAERYRLGKGIMAPVPNNLTSIISIPCLRIRFRSVYNPAGSPFWATTHLSSTRRDA